MSQGSSPATSTTPPRPGLLSIWGPSLWAAVVVLGGIFLYQLSTQIAFSARPGRLGPSFWPQAILIMMIVTAGFDLLAEVRKARARLARGDFATTAESQAKRVWWLMALGLALTLAYVNFSSVIGFPLANCLFLGGFMFLGGYRKPVSTTLIALLGTVVLILLFVRVVYVSLPLGIGPFQDLTLLLYSLLGIV